MQQSAIYWVYSIYPPALTASCLTLAASSYLFIRSMSFIQFIKCSSDGGFTALHITCSCRCLEKCSSQCMNRLHVGKKVVIVSSVPPSPVQFMLFYESIDQYGFSGRLNTLYLLSWRLITEIWSQYSFAVKVKTLISLHHILPLFFPILF